MTCAPTPSGPRPAHVTRFALILQAFLARSPRTSFNISLWVVAYAPTDFNGTPPIQRGDFGPYTMRAYGIEAEGITAHLCAQNWAESALNPKGTDNAEKPQENP